MLKTGEKIPTMCLFGHRLCGSLWP